MQKGMFSMSEFGKFAKNLKQVGSIPIISRIEKSRIFSAYVKMRKQMLFDARMSDNDGFRAFE